MDTSTRKPTECGGRTVSQAPLESASNLVGAGDSQGASNWDLANSGDNCLDQVVANKSRWVVRGPYSRYFCSLLKFCSILEYIRDTICIVETFTDEMNFFIQAAASKCIGVDPNRNFDIGHGTVGSSNNRCQDTYHGTGPFSSAEARALKVAVENIKATQKLASYVSVHAYSQVKITLDSLIDSFQTSHPTFVYYTDMSIQTSSLK